mmetsp:Transcript_10660/g.20668  ORF Transcript_10660/g.20668 Transcript_10660/m.20668 type:complete len:272 (+) Transcript_10660:1783-2598(+)
MLSIIMLWYFIGVALAVEELQVGKLYHLDQSNSLRTYHIKTNYQRTEITIECLSNINSVQWSDRLENTYQCHKDAAICGSTTGCGFSFVYVGACISDMYVVVDASLSATFSFNANYLEGACDPVVENDYTYCGALSYNDCNRCGTKCRLAECSDRYQNVVANLCLPSHVDKHEIEERCFTIADASISDWKDECKDEEVDSSSVGTVLLICFLVVTFLSFIGSVAFYHWRLRKTGQPPVNCPKFCPQALFPRTEVKPAAARSMYSPPEFYSE